MITHPLDPLDSKELTLTADIIRRQGKFDDRALFEQIRLLEPAKNIVRNFAQGGSIDRQAFAVILDRNAGKVFEAVVSLNSESLLSWAHIPDVQTSFIVEELEEMYELVKQHSDFIAGLKRRGINSADQVYIEGFAVASFASSSEKHLRLSRAHCFYAEKPGDNYRVRPIEGLIPVVDLNAMKVLRIEDNGVVVLPPDTGSYQAEQMDNLRPPLAALDISQPDGPDFEVNGHEVVWQNWRFRVGFTPREGLVLHTVSINDGGQDRPIIYRASLSELVVPYGETVGDHYMNHSFDLGEGVRSGPQF